MPATQIQRVLAQHSNMLPNNLAKFLADLPNLHNIVAFDQAVDQGCDLISQSEQAPLREGLVSLLR